MTGPGTASTADMRKSPALRPAEDHTGEAEELSFNPTLRKALPMVSNTPAPYQGSGPTCTSETSHGGVV